MSTVRKELDRLRGAIASRLGTRRGARWHLGLLIVACLLAVVNRVVVPLPGLSALTGALVPTLLVGLFLLALGPPLRRLATIQARPDPDALARTIDDTEGWRDETSTAYELPDEAVEGPVGSLLTAQASGRLKGLASEKAGTPIDRRYVLRFALVFLFVFFLLAPGIRPMWKDTGPGGEDDSWVGPTDGAISARALESDWFLSTFVADPLPVEPLPEEDGAADGGANAAPADPEGDK